MRITIIEDLKGYLQKYKIINNEAILIKGLKNNIKNNNEKNSDFKSFEEGNAQIILELKKSRGPKIRKKLLSKTTDFRCAICGSDFKNTYGNLNKAVFEIHHLIPISEGKRETTSKDVILVCANCHRVLHSSGKKPISMNELRDQIKQRYDFS